MEQQPINFHADSDKAIAHWLHLLALKSMDTRLAKGYARRDARLRNSVGMASTPSMDFQVPYDSIDALLAASPAEAPDHDSEWFQKRWDLGEKDAMKKEGLAMATSLGQLPQMRVFIAEPFHLLCSPALAQSALAHHAPNRLLCGPDVSPLWAALKCVAALLGPDLPLQGLSKPDQDWVAAHVSIGVWQLILARQDELPVWAELLSPYFLPSLYGRAETAERVLHIAEHVLNEPPGETNRIADGLGARMPSRLIRAWRRGYFVPEGFDLEGWVRQRTMASPETTPMP